MAQKKENSKKIWIFRAVLAAVLVAALLLSLIWSAQINVKLGLTKEVVGEYDGAYKTEEILELGGDMNVHFVDVGQGDACVVELPDNKTMLIDAGDTHTENTNKLLDYIEKNINQPNGEDIDHFDYVILTHPDSDHCGGMAKVLDKYPASVFYRPNVTAVKPSSVKGEDAFADPLADEIKEGVRDDYEEYRAASKSQKIKEFDDWYADRNTKNTVAYYGAIEAGYNLDKTNGVETTVYISDATDEDNSVIAPEGLSENDPNYYTFTFYAPIGSVSYSDWNDYSPVMILEYHGKRFMFSGDAEKEAEASFVAVAKEGKGKYAIFTEDFTVDVFKLGHHGSSTSSSLGMLEVMTTPASCPNVIAIVSCGKNNKYGHPHSEVITRLGDLGFTASNIVRTDENGTIAMSVTGVETDGVYGYELRMGAETVKRVEAAIGNDTLHLTWMEIAVLAIIAVIALLIVLPLVTALKKSAKKAVRSAGMDTSFIDDIVPVGNPTKSNSTSGKSGTTTKSNSVSGKSGTTKKSAGTKSGTSKSTKK